MSLYLNEPRREPPLPIGIGAGHWSARYVGETYVVGTNDCAAFAVRVQQQMFGRDIHLPTARGLGARDWSKQIDALAEDYGIRTDTPVDGDAVLMRCRGHLSHIGIYCLIGNVPHVLHAMKNAGQVCLHRLRDLDKQGLWLEGCYRWKA
jgi:hypothetical protein